MTAVDVSKGTLEYGNEHRGMCDVSLTLEKGNIYALLGPSGCGKTTLLNAVVGLKTLQSGTVSIFGHPPRSKTAGVPGPWLGYMPQETCLCAQLTSEETLRFIGLLHCLPRGALQARVQLLLTLLEIPSNQRAGTMSSGQRRRLSLAVAMVHDPPLLVLDEPTVGVDPMLRMVIWKHLLELTNGQGKTILFTTHYIREASSAHVVGFMREGRILKQANPQQAMEEYQTRSLDEVFLQICLSAVSEETDFREDSRELRSSLEAPGCSGVSSITTRNTAVHRTKEGSSKELASGSSNSSKQERKNGIANPVFEIEKDDAGLESIPLQEFSSKQETLEKRNLCDGPCLPKTEAQQPSANVPRPETSWKASANRIYAVTWKTTLVTRRNLVLLAITFLSPISNIFLQKYLLFQTPSDIPVAIVNDDNPPLFSKQLIRNLDRTTFDLKFFDNFEKAEIQRKEQKVSAVIHIRPEYTTSLMKRFQEGLKSDNSTVVKTFVHLYTDPSNMEVYRTIYNSLLEAYGKFQERNLKLLGKYKRAAQQALTFEKPVMGSENSDFSYYVTMNIIPDSVFIVSLAFTVLVFTADVVTGFQDRIYVSGVTDFQMIVSHFLVSTFISTTQIIFLVVFLVCYKYENNGSYVLVCFILYLTSFLGIALGILLVTLNCRNNVGLFVVITIYWSNDMLSGVIWPVESFPPVVQTITNTFPCTWLYRAVRLVVNNGLGLNKLAIWKCILVPTAWMIGFLSVSLILRRRTNGSLRRRAEKLFRSFMKGCSLFFGKGRGRQ